MAGDARFCSISKAAELVSKAEGQPVERSTLSRYIKRYATDIEQRREGRETLIDVDALIEHRKINIRVERGSAAPYLEDRRIASSKERKGEIEVRKAEIELEEAEEERARKRGEIISVAEMVKAAEAAVQAMSAALDRAENDAADDIAKRTRSEVRHVRPGLRILKRAALEAFRASLFEVVPAPPSEEGDEDDDHP
ncbi:hypothetical protein [Bosea sp. (in: a-proteobacteria)]|uniref:hypothetical protein n=1 Tax=Bosea sp. (in: a-proteobacteria) TaxID=1871050 RepID=UPI003B3A547C